eukprot:jgi/Galph1/5006/GphlegSOOS_G3612.1
MSKKVETNTMQEERNYFLLKSEPESRLEKGVDVSFSIEDLEREPKQTAVWDGVRNYQARNILRSMKQDDLAFFYYSNCKQPGIVGVVRITREAFPDPTQFDPRSPYHDSKSSKEEPKWVAVEVTLEEKWHRKVSLEELKSFRFKELKDMPLFTRTRLSVQPVQIDHWNFIIHIRDNKIL